MKKVERINIIMRYINNRSQFTISEIMQEFGISRSTAIRDIREIETMGMPLVAEVGRAGGYFVMKNSVLPAIRFTEYEIKALFIAFMATRNKQLPYLKSRQSLAEKLLGLISESHQEELILLNQILLFDGTNPKNPDLLELSDLPHPLLEKLIQLILIDNHLVITVHEETTKNISIYLLHLYYDRSHWMIEGYDLMEEKSRLFSVDHLIDVNPYVSNKRMNEKRMSEKQTKHEETANLVLELGPTAIGQFKKYHPFKFTLSYTNPYQATALLKTFVDVEKADELNDIVNWVLFLGEDVEFKEVPVEVKEILVKRSNLYPL